MAGPASTTLPNCKDRSAGPVYSGGGLCPDRDGLDGDDFKVNRPRGVGTRDHRVARLTCGTLICADAPQPRRAASMAATSIFFIVIIASNARLAAALSGPKTACVRAIGVICQDNPHLSLHQPH